MTEGNASFETKIAVLTKRIDDQARFTRAVVVVCTTAILGVMFYMLTEIFASLPAVIVTTGIGQIDKVVYIWKATEAGITRNAAAQKSANTAGASTTTGTGNAAK